MENKDKLLNDIVPCRILSPNQLLSALIKAEELIVHELLIKKTNECDEVTDTLNDVIHPIYLFRKGLEQRMNEG